jgi:hypothetical protein
MTMMIQAMMKMIVFVMTVMLMVAVVKSITLIENANNHCDHDVHRSRQPANPHDLDQPDGSRRGLPAGGRASVWWNSRYQGKEGNTGAKSKPSRV